MRYSCSGRNVVREVSHVTLRCLTYSYEFNSSDFSMVLRLELD